MTASGASASLLGGPGRSLYRGIADPSTGIRGGRECVSRARHPALLGTGETRRRGGRRAPVRDTEGFPGGHCVPYGGL